METGVLFIHSFILLNSHWNQFHPVYLLFLLPLFKLDEIFKRYTANFLLQLNDRRRNMFFIISSESLVPFYTHQKSKKIEMGSIS